jgi:hypothetical protein
MDSLLRCGLKSFGQDTVDGVFRETLERLKTGPASRSFLRRSNCCKVRFACFLYSV